MPEISEDQADALRALHWLLSEEPDHRRSGRSRVLAIAFLRLACQRPADTWITIFDHSSAPEGRRVVLRFIWEIASEIPVPIDINEQEGRFRLRNVDDEVRRFMYQEFRVSGIEFGLTAGEVERIRAHSAPGAYMPEDVADQVMAAVHNPPRAGELDVITQNTMQEQAQQGALGQAAQQFAGLGAQLAQFGNMGGQQVQQGQQQVAQQGYQMPAMSGLNDQGSNQLFGDRLEPARSLRRRARQGLPMRQAVINYVLTHPGLSAHHIAQAIGQQSSSVSSTLLKEVEAGTLRREPTGGGSRGGWLYYAAEKPAAEPTGPSVWDRLRKNPFDDES